ncbi:MAG: hypothetical protein JKX94_06560, partial [Sneathiella sp.]|nr:hypothetical protein [Sneathiella sp.]
MSRSCNGTFKLATVSQQMLTICAAGFFLPFIGTSLTLAQTSQNNSPSVVIPSEPGFTGGGYATQAKPATQAGQARQATQAQGYTSPYTPSNPYSPQISTPQAGSKGSYAISPSISGTRSGGAIVDYNSSKGKTGTYQIPSNLVPSKTNPNSVLQGEVNVRSTSNPSLNEDYNFQERATSGSSPVKSATGSTTKKTAPATTGNTLITVTPSSKIETPSRTSTTTSTTDSKTPSTNKASSVSTSTGNTLITVTPSSETKSDTKSSSTEGSATSTETDETASTSAKTDTNTETPISPADSPSSNTMSDYDRALKKAEKEQLRRARMEGAATAMQGSRDRAMGLLNNNETMMPMSDAPRAQIDFNAINSLSASIGQFLKSGVSMAAVNPGLSAPEEEPLCAAPEISEELQKQLDEEKKQLQEALRKEREKKEKKLKKLKADAEADKKVKNRKKAKQAEEKRQKKFKKLAKKRQKMQEERDRLDAAKEKNQKKYDEAKKDEYKARKGPPSDPNCNSANCQKHQKAQGEARNELNKVQKGEQQFEQDRRDLKTEEREYKEYADALEDALDKGFGQTPDQTKKRLLDKQQRAMRDQQQEKQKRIAELQNKAKGGTRDSYQDKQRLKEMTRDLDGVKRQRKAAQDYIDANADNDDVDFDKIMNARQLVEKADDFISAQANLENSVDYQDSQGRGLNGGEQRELDRLRAENKQYENYLNDSEKSPAARANELGQQLEADGIPPIFDTLDTASRDAEIQALEGAIGDLKAAEDRVQNFKGQPDVKAQKAALDANEKAQAELKELRAQAKKHYDALPRPYPDQSKDIKKAKELKATLNRDPNSTWKDRNDAKVELDRLENAQARHDRQYLTLNRQSAEQFGDKVAAAEEKAHLTGIRATGAKAQQIVSEYNRGLPDVFGADGKVSPAKVNKIAAGIDKQLEDVARVNAELGTLNEIRGNLIPGPNGGKSIAEQAGMSAKGVAKRLNGIDGRIETAAGFRNKLQVGLKRQGFNSKVSARGQCTINSVNSAMGAAYVKGARRALERKAGEKKTRMAALSGAKGGAPKGTASPAAKAIAKNVKNVQNVKQVEQAKQFQMGGGQCSGAGGPAASCAGGKAPQRGLVMAGKATKEFSRMAGLAVGGVGGAVIAAGKALTSESFEDFRRQGKRSDLASLSSREAELGKKIAGHNVLLESAPRGGFQEQVLSQQRFGYITEREALEPKIAKLTADLEAEDAKAAKKVQLEATTRIETATANFEKAIGDIDGNIEAVEEVMASVENANIPGLLPALEGQREGLFAGRAYLQGKLK